MSHVQDTDANVLKKKNVNIWDGNSSREFLDSRGLDYTEGILGPVYGFQWRSFGAKYAVENADTSSPDYIKPTGGVDQLAYVEDLLRNDPTSRRIFLSSWNPVDLSKMALPPCHISLQLYVDDGMLSGKIYMRSVDIFLGCPFNIVSYAVMIYILAKRCDLKPARLVISFGDGHLYLNHLDQAKEQLCRVPLAPPVLKLSDAVKTKDFSELTIDDFELIGYQSHARINAQMSA